MTSTRTSPTANSEAGTSKRAVGIAAALLVVAVLVALVVALTSGGSDETDPAQAAASLIPQGEVRQVSFAEVSGPALPRFDAAVVDPARGVDAPSFTASYFDNTEVTVDPADGTARVMLFVAHWCPHCQDEVTSLTGWFADNGVPDDIEVVAISTGVDEGAPNYPPATWLLREGWPVPVLRDSASSDLAAGYGLSSFPYIVAIDDEGKVVSRSSGQMSEAQWENLIASLRG